MKQSTATIRLRESMDRDDGWGRTEGREVFDRLLAIVDANPEVALFRISLAGVRRTDASFPRESVAELAKRFRGKKGFCLVEVEDADLLDNWDAAANKKEQPLLVWYSRGRRLLGPAPSEGLRALFDFVADRSGTTTSEAATVLGLNVPNASNKLKALWEQGYVLRRERVAATGGIEFEYLVPR